jgi:hypothetical protein
MAIVRRLRIHPRFVVHRFVAREVPTMRYGCPNSRATTQNESRHQSPYHGHARYAQGIFLPYQLLCRTLDKSIGASVTDKDACSPRYPGGGSFFQKAFLSQKSMCTGLTSVHPVYTICKPGLCTEKNSSQNAATVSAIGIPKCFADAARLRSGTRSRCRSPQRRYPLDHA